LNAIKVDLKTASQLLGKRVSGMTGQEMWVVYLAYSNDPRHREVIDEIKVSREAIKMVDIALWDVSQDEAQRQAYINRLFAENDAAHDRAVIMHEAQQKAQQKALRKVEKYWKPKLAEREKSWKNEIKHLKNEIKNWESRKE
jgi:hypothetical protein